MQCQIYRADVPTLLAVLSDAATVARWQQAVADETPSLADRPLLAYLKKLNAIATHFLVSGFDQYARQDLAGADALLSDIFAVATWNQWELPIEHLNEQDIDVSTVPRGFLAADPGFGASVWLLDHGTIAISRERQASDQADWSNHVRSC